MPMASVIEDATQPATVVNVASIPLLSPFRYPGGKTWLVPLVRRWVTSLPAPPAFFCEPFCGGAIVGLSILFEGLAEKLLLVELDADVATVWQSVLNGDAVELTDRIRKFEMNRESVERLLSEPHSGTLDRAFATIVRNRVQRGGIMAPGASLMKQGEGGRGVASRWYPKTLEKRIREIQSRSSAIGFFHRDGITYMKSVSNRTDTVYFIDPPYTVAGRRLYVHSDVDHEELFRVASRLHGDFLMTYDDSEAIRTLAQRSGFDTQTVAMKNTHHRIMRELLIGRDLSWART